METLDRTGAATVTGPPVPRAAATRPPRGPARREQVAGVAVAAVAWCFALAALAVLALGGATPELLAYWLMDLLSAVVYGGATLLVLPRSRHPAVLILAATAVGCGASAFLTAYIEASVVHPGLWLPAWAVVLSGWIWVPGTYAGIAVLPWLVSPQAASRRVRGVAAVGAALVTWCVLTRMTARYVGLDNPLAVLPESFYAVTRHAGLWPDRLCVVLSLAGVARLLWVRATVGAERARGYAWLALGQLFMAVAFLPVVYPAPAAVQAVATDFAGLSLMAAQPFLPGALLVVVLGHRLWGIDLAVDRAIVWLVLSGVVVTGYLLVTWLAQRLVAAPEEVTNMATVALLLVGSQPLRGLVQRRVDHLVYGPDNDLAALLTSVGGVAGSASGSERTLDVLAEALAAGLRLDGVQITGRDGALLAARGRLDEATHHRVDLVVGGRQVGRLGVDAVAGQALDNRTRRLVDQMAGVIAVFVELALVNERLDAASQHLLEVRHEERRQLRRDLHDGMGPALAGVALGIAAAQRKVGHDPEGTRRLLDELEVEVSDRIEEVRLLARSLLPAALDDGDLSSALDVLAARFQTSGLRVRVDCAGLEPLDTRRQVAVYHVAAEALLNAHRHGRARRVEITVSGGGTRSVRLEVTDDGCGLAAEAPAGVGLRSMRERAQEQSGSLHVAPGRGGTGTRVELVLP